MVTHKSCVLLHVHIHTTCSATAGEDFAPEPLIAVFAPGQREAAVFLDIVDNAEVEQDEALILQMEVGDFTSEEIEQSMVTIWDNDGVCTST